MTLAFLKSNRIQNYFDKRTKRRIDHRTHPDRRLCRNGGHRHADEIRQGNDACQTQEKDESSRSKSGEDRGNMLPFSLATLNDREKKEAIQNCKDYDWEKVDEHNVDTTNGIL